MQQRHGITLCTGSYGSRRDNDLVAMAREFAARMNFAHLRNVTVEPDGSFFEDDHLDGDTDMVGVIEMLMQERRPPGIPPQTSSRRRHREESYPGYSYIGRLKGLESFAA